ncbi:MAG TPA: M48 family metalloprotease [Chlamydiales bacterium]|nr:M48 family metalloprotease [Chlamydiales bacterium]
MIQAPSRFRIDLDHTEQLMRAVAAFTVDPLKNIVFYTFPFLRAMSSNYVQMRENDASQDAMMPSTHKSLILGEIENLSLAAKISRTVLCYAALNHHFGSYGGGCSLTKPAVFLPIQHLFRIGLPPFTQAPDPTLAGGLWNFSDHQTRFLICRELAQIKHNNVMLRIAIKISLIAAGFVFYATPLSWMGGLILFITALALYILSEKRFESKMDQFAVDILAQKLDRPLAIQTAIQTLEKMVEQNIARRNVNPLCRLYTRPNGNNLLDLTHPFLTSRIQRLKKMI